MSWEQIFESKHPKPVDFSEIVYKQNKDEIDRIATQHGYSLRGYRLGRAVFSTKKTAGESATR